MALSVGVGATLLQYRCSGGCGGTARAGRGTVPGRRSRAASRSSPSSTSRTPAPPTRARSATRTRSTSSSAARATCRSATSCSCPATATPCTSARRTRSPRRAPTATRYGASGAVANSGRRLGRRPRQHPGRRDAQPLGRLVPDVPAAARKRWRGFARRDHRDDRRRLRPRAHPARCRRSGRHPLQHRRPHPDARPRPPSAACSAQLADALKLAPPTPRCRASRRLPKSLLVQVPGAHDRHARTAARSRSTRTTARSRVDLAALLKQLGVEPEFAACQHRSAGLPAQLPGQRQGPVGRHAGCAARRLRSAAEANFTDCVTAFTKKFPPPLGPLLQTLLDALTAGQQQIQARSTGRRPDSASAGGGNPLRAAGQRAQAGCSRSASNVQPNGSSGTFASALKATPDQATPVIAGQTIVRALEINLRWRRRVPAWPLANAAAGPSSRPAPPPAQPTTTPPSGAVKHDHRLPTGIPAGQGPIGGGGSPHLPLVLLRSVRRWPRAGASDVVWTSCAGRSGI